MHRVEAPSADENDGGDDDDDVVDDDGDDDDDYDHDDHDHDHDHDHDYDNDDDGTVLKHPAQIRMMEAMVVEASRWEPFTMNTWTWK